MTIPTFDEDIATATAGLVAAEKVDADEVRSFVLMYRALEATRPSPAQPEPPALIAGFTIHSTRPLAQAELKEQMERMRAAIDELLAAPPDSHAQ